MSTVKPSFVFATCVPLSLLLFSCYADGLICCLLLVSFISYDIMMWFSQSCFQKVDHEMPNWHGWTVVEETVISQFEKPLTESHRLSYFF